MNYNKKTKKEIAGYLNAVRKSMQGSPEEEIDEVVLHLQEQIDVALQESGEAADEADTISGILSAMSPPESFAVAKNEQPRESRKGYVALTLALISLVFLVFGFPALLSFPVFVSAIVLAVMSRKTVSGKVAIGLLILAPILFIVVHYIGVAPANRQAKTEAKTEEPAAKVTKQDTMDSLTDEIIVQRRHFCEAIASAKDKASAQEAVKKLNRIGDEFAAIAARMDKLETPSEEEKERIDEKMLSAGKAMEEKFEEAMQDAIFNEEVSGIIAPAVREFAEIRCWSIWE